MKSNKGITLIALVVTIIILLILVGVSITTLSGDGLFGRAQTSVVKYERASQAEEGTLGALIDTYDQVEDSLIVRGCVTWDLNGGKNGSSSDDIQRTYKVGDTIDSFPYAWQNYYNFVGWFTAREGGTQITTDTVVPGDVTYYAHWEPHTYTMTWTQPIASIGSYINSIEPEATRTTNCYDKEIIVEHLDGTKSLLNPYVAQSITFPYGTKFYFCYYLDTVAFATEFSYMGGSSATTMADGRLQKDMSKPCANNDHTIFTITLEEDSVAT